MSACEKGKRWELALQFFGRVQCVERVGGAKAELCEACRGLKDGAPCGCMYVAFNAKGVVERAPPAVQDKEERKRVWIPKVVSLAIEEVGPGAPAGAPPPASAGPSGADSVA